MVVWLRVVVAVVERRLTLEEVFDIVAVSWGVGIDKLWTRLLIVLANGPDIVVRVGILLRLTRLLKPRVLIRCMSCNKVE